MVFHYFYISRIILYHNINVEHQKGNFYCDFIIFHTFKDQIICLLLIFQLIWLNSNLTKIISKIILVYIFDKKVLSLFLT